MSQFNLIGYSNSGANVLNLTCSNNGAMLMPFGVSNERPVSAEAGMLRYNTTENIFEYYNGTEWLPVSLPPPSITSITPQYVQNTISDNSINIIGTNFSINPFVQFISDVNGQVISAQSQTYNSESSITAVISNTMRDLSSLYPFSVKVTNNSNLTNILGNALFWNEVPTFTTAQSPTVYAEIAEGTGNLTGQLDLSAVDIGGHTPLHFSSTDLSGNTSNALTLDSSGFIVGNASGLSASNYNFTATVTDQNQGFTSGNFTFAVLAQTAFTTTLDASTSYLEAGSTIDQAGTISIGGPVLGGWTIVTFKTTGSGTITFTNISSPIEAKYLVVAGGGGGASLFGGGGAGGFREGKQNISSSSYNVTVGAGGAGGYEPTTSDPTKHGFDGSPSLFDSIQSAGGGGGGNARVGANGGSGGGGGDWSGVAYAGGIGNTPSVSPSQGANGGGVAASGVDAGAGGGGGGGPSGLVGGQGSASGGGNGGNGTTTTIIPTSLATTLSVGQVSGSNLYFAGGGGGGCWFGGGAVGTAKAGLGGLGGGAAGPQATRSSLPAGDPSGNDASGNTGGGGSGSTRSTFPAQGGNGGSGVVILRFPSYI